MPGGLWHACLYWRNLPALTYVGYWPTTSYVIGGGEEAQAQVVSLVVPSQKICSFEDSTISFQAPGWLRACKGDIFYVALAQGGVAGHSSSRAAEGRALDSTFRDISRFPPRIDRIFPGEALNPFFGAQDEGLSEFRFTYCVTDLKHKEITINPKPQTLKKKVFRKPYTLYNPKL